MQEKLEVLEQEILRLKGESVSTIKNSVGPLLEEVYEEIKKEKIEDIPTLLKLSQLENLLSIRMIDASPKIEPASASDSFKAIEHLVFYTRNQASSKLGVNVVEDSLRTRSKDFSLLLLENARNLGIPATMIDLEITFSFPYPHYVVLAYVEEFYLLDLTYQEFFLLGYNFPNRYYPHPTFLRVCEIGGRMMGEREHTAREMIENGYLKVASKEFQEYGDACLEFGGKEEKFPYFEEMMKQIERSSEKSDRILLSKMHNL